MDFSEALRSAARNPDLVEGDERIREIALRLAEVHERIDRALESSGRLERPELIVVTKTFPAEDVARLYRLGVRDVGENKDQEAARKAADVRVLLEAHGAGSDPLRWHFVGQLQSNKAKSVVGYAHSVQSVDRPSLVKALRKAVAGGPSGAPGAVPRAEDAALECLIQVSLDDDDAAQAAPDGASGPGARGGAAADRIPDLAREIEAAPGLRLGGLMAVAPPHGPARAAFDRLSRLSRELTEEHPRATAISAGMSGDLEEAVASGATRLRVGRDVLGQR